MKFIITNNDQVHSTSTLFSTSHQLEYVTLTTNKRSRSVYAACTERAVGKSETSSPTNTTYEVGKSEISSPTNTTYEATPA